MSYLKRRSKGRAPQSAPIPGSGQVPNSAGGFAWVVDDWARLRRFLILGSEGGSYYAGEWKLTRENAEAVERCLAVDGPRTVAEIVAVSDAGRAPKNDPAIFALPMPREAAPTELLSSAEVWEALLDGMPMTALVRSLATMTRVGVLSPGSAGTAKVLAQLALLAALRTYASGRGVRGRHTWTPVVQIVAGKQGWKSPHRSRWQGTTDGLTPLAISPRQRLDDVVCSETWAGDVHPAQALRDYRRASGIEARLVVVGMVSNGFSIADPQDPGMLDVVGFDTATPQLVSDFARGAL